MLNIAVLGFGFIGSGVADVFCENESVISRKLGDTVNIKYILDIKDISGPLSDRLVRDINIILDDPEISVIVEAFSGPPQAAYEYTKAALERGISVVTPNKAVVAKHGAELLKIAADTDARYLFEASVGGGIPIIRPIYNCLAANKIEKITAILNATTNFILTKMAGENLSFETALETAQELGYAERDPSSDVEGLDTCRKLCILSSLAFGRHLPPEKVYTEGITGVTLEDIKNAGKIGCKIRLVAKSEKSADDLQAVVAPMLVYESSPLYTVDDIFNGIIVTGNMAGDIMFYGKGAGKPPTSSAIVADVIDALTKSTKNMSWEASDGSYVHKLSRSAYYIRVSFIDLDETHNIINKIFENCDIHEANAGHELFFITEELEDNKYDEKIKILKDAGLEVKSSIRML